VKATPDNLVIKWPLHQSLATIEEEIRRLTAIEPRSLQPQVSESARDALKFAEWLPVDLADQVVKERLSDPTAIAGTIARPTRMVSTDRSLY
jgi:hypothetical protein